MPYSLLDSINEAIKKSIPKRSRLRLRRCLLVGLVIIIVVGSSIVVLHGLPRETCSNSPDQNALYPLQNVASVKLQAPQIASVQLNVPFCDQDESVNNQYKLPGICWDTSTEMILNYWYNEGYLASVPTQGEIYSATMSCGGGGNLNAALAALGFFTAEFNPQQTLYTSYSDFYQQNNALNASQMIYAAQLALSYGVPLLATVETQPYPQATMSTGGILCDSRGGDHAVTITGYNQTGFFFNSATNEQYNPAFVCDDSLNTYATVGRVVNGFDLYCPYSEFAVAYSNGMWCFTAIFPINYATIMQQQRIQLIDASGDPVSGMLVSSPFSSATTDSKGYATLTISDLGAPISVGNNMHANADGNYCGQYAENADSAVGYTFSEDCGMYMLYPSINECCQVATNFSCIEYLQ